MKYYSKLRSFLLCLILIAACCSAEIFYSVPALAEDTDYYSTLPDDEEVIASGESASSEESSEEHETCEPEQDDEEILVPDDEEKSSEEESQEEETTAPEAETEESTESSPQDSSKTTVIETPSAATTVKIKVSAPKISKITAPARNKLKITWKKVANASGYKIYMSKKKSSGYKLIKTIKGNKTFRYTKSGLANSTVYYFRIKAYRTVSGKTYYSSLSARKYKKTLKAAVTTKKLTRVQKCRKIWGTTYYVHYKSAKKASRNMTTIRIKTWDIKKNGKKYTRYFSLTVHKNIAPTVKKIFNTIYQGKEKFPIHNVGGYSYRSGSSSEHNEGLAIDINWQENPYINLKTGKTLVGGKYRPGKDPYSIPAGGDVVKAFKKYGFSWGKWSTRVDYMHFSYFGL